MPSGMTPMRAGAAPEKVQSVSERAGSAGSPGSVSVETTEGVSGLSVRRYFARLLIGSGRGGLPKTGEWQTVPVDRFFLAMNRQTPLINPEREQCSDGVETLGAVLSGFTWD